MQKHLYNPPCQSVRVSMYVCVPISLQKPISWPNAVRSDRSDESDGPDGSDGQMDQMSQMD